MKPNNTRWLRSTRQWLPNRRTKCAQSSRSAQQCERRVVLLHYAPIRATVEGEAPEIFPFLGSTRLEEPINRFRVSACFHGHAHNGTAEGATATNVPVFNVSVPLLQRRAPDKQPSRLFEI